MKNILVLLLATLFGSCQFFDSKVPSEEELLQKRLDEINWKEVSTYPSLPECDSITDKETKKNCFFTSLTRLVQKRLDIEPLVALNPQSDTLQVTVTVFPDSTVLFYSDSTVTNSIKIDSILRSQLADFPKIEPAQKEGVPVKSRFILPVILNVD